MNDPASPLYLVCRVADDQRIEVAQSFRTKSDAIGYIQSAEMHTDLFLTQGEAFATFDLGN